MTKQTYPIYHQDNFGRTQIKRIDPETHSVISLIMGDNEYTRAFDVKCKTTEMDELRFAKLMYSTENEFLSLADEYANYMTDIINNLKQGENK